MLTMRHIVIHVGFHKTGSTSIQHALTSNNLNSFGYSYYGFGAQNGSKGMANLFSKTLHENIKKKSHFKQLKLHDTQQDYHLINLLEFITNNNNNLIVSGEDISDFSATDLIKVKEFFSSFKLKIKIVIYVRPLHNYIESQWVQKLTNSNDYTSLSFNSNFWLQRLDLKGRITKFDHVFGEDNVNVYCYNKKDFPNGSVTAHFFSVLKIPYTSNNVQEDNIRLSLPAAQLAYLYRIYKPKDETWNELRANESIFIDQIRKIKGPKLYFHSNLINPYINSFASQQLWIESRTLQSFENENHDEYPHVIRQESDLLSLKKEAVNWLSNTRFFEAKKHPLDYDNYLTISNYLYSYVISLTYKDELPKTKRLFQQILAKLKKIYHYFIT
jgi:hypothetical protein